MKKIWVYGLIDAEVLFPSLLLFFLLFTVCFECYSLVVVEFEARYRFYTQQECCWLDVCEVRCS